METTLDYRDILQDFYLIKREGNPLYSLRSFARDLGLPSSNLINVLNKKQGLSLRSAEKVATKLKIQGAEKERFLCLVEASDARAKKTRLLAEAKLKTHFTTGKKRLVDDHFNLISDWHYFAALELMTLKSFKSDPKWIGKKLGLDAAATVNVLNRLARLNLIKREGQAYVTTGAQLETVNDIPSHALKKHHAQLLKKASEALLEQNVDDREITSLTIAINKKDLPFVKQRIREFKRSLDKELVERTKAEGADRVYCLSMQFFDVLNNREDL